MRKLYICLLALFAAGTISAQSVTECGTTENENRLQQQNPARLSERKAYEQEVQRWTGSQPSVQAVITIPVVIHVVWSQTAQNISNNQIFSQMQVLNEDFGRTNSDTGNAPNAFQSLGVNTNIQFCLAQQDPQGNASNGIERTQTTVSSWSPNDWVKSAGQGGADAWDPTRYFNIWVCNLIPSGQSSYAEVPTGAVSATYGLVVDYHWFGSDHTSFGTFTDIVAPYDRGRESTHEISHCFDLIHIWGNDGSACTGSDSCADTPNQGGQSSGCPTFPHTDACSPSSPGVMFCNYMDKSAESCRNMFTNDQKMRMLAVLSMPPYNALASSTTCSAPGNQAPQALIQGATSGCVNVPVTFTDASLNNPNSWSWTFSGGTPNSSTSQNPTAVTWSAVGTYTITLTVTNGVGSTTITQIITINNPPATPSITVNGSMLTSTVTGASYQWFLNGNPISGANSVSYTATQTGTFTVEVYDAAGCASGQSAGVVDPTGIAVVPSFGNISLSPNPNDGKFELRFTANQTDNFTLEIHNALGQVVYSESLENFNGSYMRSIDLSAFGKGVYTVRLKSSTGDTVLRAVTY